jgi:VRR-NUC domain
MPPRTRRPPVMTGGDVQQNAIDLAHLYHLLVAHFRPAQTVKGWRTPVAADGKGWPDLVIAGPGGMLYREVKGEEDALTPEQEMWLAALRVAGADVAVWRPGDWESGRIRRELQVLRRRSNV